MVLGIGQLFLDVGQHRQKVLYAHIRISWGTCMEHTLQLQVVNLE